MLSNKQAPSWLNAAKRVSVRLRFRCGRTRRAYGNILMQTFDVLNLIFRVGRSIYDGDLVGARRQTAENRFRDFAYETPPNSARNRLSTTTEERIGGKAPETGLILGPQSSNYRDVSIS
jgi:hypothetical protein